MKLIPPLEDMERRRVNATLHGRSVPRDADVPGHNVFKGYGEWARNGHVGVGDGVDLFADGGDQVVAIGDCVQTVWRNDGEKLEVIYLEGDGWLAVYAHINARHEGTDIEIEAGEVVGWVRKDLSDPHLHFELWIDGKAVTAETGEGLRDEMVGLMTAGEGASPPAPSPSPTSAQEKGVTADPQRLRGVDVSHWDGTVDWERVAEAGYRFAILKATDGVNMVDPTLTRNLVGARAAGLYVGLYHFFQPTRNGARQAECFVEAVKRATGKATGEEAWHNLLVPVLDVETAGTMTGAQMVASVLAFEKRVEELVGRGAIIYTYPSFIQEHLAPRAEGRALHWWPLWIASYPATGEPDDEPNVPGIWTEWRFWQYSEKGRVAGIPAKGVDLNVCRGGWEEMEDLLVR